MNVNSEVKKLTRRSAKSLQETLFPGQVLPKIVTDFHMALCGSSDPYSDRLRQTLTQMLKDTIACWEPSTPKHERFDNAVKELILAVLEEEKRNA